MLRYKHIAATGNLSVSAAGGATFWNASINTAAASAVFKVYDGIDATGILIASLDASIVQNPWFGVYCPNGIFCVLSGGNADVTVGFQ